MIFFIYFIPFKFEMNSQVNGATLVKVTSDPATKELEVYTSPCSQYET